MAKKKKKPQVKQHPYEGSHKHAQRKNRRNKNKREKRAPLLRASQIPFGLIIIAYFLVVTFTPNWMALDTNASKFMTLSFLNLISFGYLLTRNDIRNEPGLMMRFFDTWAGKAYGAFMVVVVLSFIPAINTLESVLQFAKVFAVFAAVFNVSLILLRDISYVKLVLVMGITLLIFDSLSVFYHIGEFINGEIGSVSDIKSVYSNKNILTSALFVKIPFALYLWMFSIGWRKRLGLFGMFVGMLAVMFMYARAFYLGLIVITLIFAAYSIYNYYRERSASHLRLLAGFVGALLLAFLIFTFIRSNMYPERQRDRSAIGTQLATIQDDAQESSRINAWTWSLDLIKRNPVLGVGAGNWKINILEYENQHKTDYIYIYKAHNDFVEVTTETGLIGGLLYISIFVFIFWNLIKAYLYKDRNTRRYRHLFLAGVGLLFYSVDAFFNFPLDRPEIQMLFAFYLAIGIVTTLSHDDAESEDKDRLLAEEPKEKDRKRKGLSMGFAALMILLMLGTAYILHTNFQSNKLQRTIYQDIMRGSLDHDPDEFLAEFPFIPNITIWGESVNSAIARYLLQEERNEEVIELLRPDADVNPWDARREFFMASAFNNMGEADSALVYSQKAYELKPYYFRNVHLLTRLMQQKGQEDEVGPYLDRFLEKVRDDRQAYLYATSFYGQRDKLDKAWEHIETAYQRMPNDSLIERQYRYIEHQKFIEPHRDLYQEAAVHYNNQRYEEALPHLNEYIEKTPFQEGVYRMRAFSHYHLENYEASIEDLNRLFEEDEEDASLINLRGVCLQALGDQEAACEDFRRAMEMGNASGERNFRNFCGGED